mmetsp:Transcript_17422/g.19405  ORF Transcript_17422/g.19405 Transcript_17422/m.19405 type:complete len:256 (+) Transcript_17422:32-799(+)
MMEQCLRELYPDVTWKKWKFSIYVQKKWTEVSKRKYLWQKPYWMQEKNQKAFLMKLQRNLNITTPEMWYRVSFDDLKYSGGSGIRKYWPRALLSLRPEFPWQWRAFSHLNKQAKQRALIVVLCDIFPNMDIIEEFAVEMTDSISPYITVDAYIPSLDLAFEYQGEQHYTDVLPWHSSGMQISRDNVKAEKCRSAGISLIPIPFWWKGDHESVVATILYYRPTIGLMPTHAQPLLQSIANEMGHLMKPNQVSVVVQ